MILFFCKLGFAEEARSSAEITSFKQSSVHSISVHHKPQMWSRPLSVCVCGYEAVYWRPVCLITFLSLSSCFPWLWWSVLSSTNDLVFGLVSDPIVTDCSALELTEWGWQGPGTHWITWFSSALWFCVPSITNFFLSFAWHSAHSWLCPWGTVSELRHREPEY